MFLDVGLNITIILLSLALGFLVFKAGPEKLSNRFFLGFNVSISLWIVSSLTASLTGTHFAQAMVNIGFAAVAFIAYFFLAFCISFSEEKERLPGLYTQLFLPAFIFFLLALFGQVAIAQINIDSSFVIKPGLLYIPYSLFLVAYAITGLAILVNSYRKEKKLKRSQLFYVLTGTAIYIILALFFSLVAPTFSDNQNLYKWGIYSVSIFLSITAYAILTHQLFDIRIVVRRTVVFTALFTFIIVTYSVSALLLRGAILGEAVALDFKADIVNLVTICVIGFAIEPLRRWLTVKTDQFLFKREYDMQEVITGLTKELIGVINLDEALALLMQTLVKVMHLHHAVVYVFQMGEHGEIAVKRIRQSGYLHPSRLMQDAGSDTIQYFLDKPDLLLKTRLDIDLMKEAEILKNPRASSEDIGMISTFVKKHTLKQSVSEKMKELNASIAIPLFVGKQPIGLIFLSEKKSGEAYTEDDLSLLETIGSQTITAIQKAKLYDDDHAKSEFVSIASHELLTPISAIQGYLSMILEEKMGKVDPQARGYLEKVYSSTKRLRFLVKDLLSVSRIESGKMKVDLQSLDLVKTIDETIDQLQFLADEKHLKLHFNKPYSSLPSVLADSDRLMEVLINLIGNSIKYTPEGSVTISVDSLHSGNFLRVDITDTGIGMSKEAQAHLFEKFYRIDSPETTGITGTGLGLFITKSIVEKMGGNVSVKSKQGEGSTFSINLPVFQVEAAHPPQKPRADHVTMEPNS